MLNVACNVKYFIVGSLIVILGFENDLQTKSVWMIEL